MIVALQKGNVAHFVYLHLDSASKCPKTSEKEKHSWYEVEGKARPMIVLSDRPRRRYGGVDWYQVIRLTTCEKKGWTKRIGAILDGKETFGYEPEWYPHSLLSKEHTCTSVDDNTLRCVLRMFGF